MSALALLSIGVSEDAVLDDYTLSDDAYSSLDDKAAMVGALAQHDLGTLRSNVPATHCM